MLVLLSESQQHLEPISLSHTNPGGPATLVWHCPGCRSTTFHSPTLTCRSEEGASLNRDTDFKSIP